MQTVHQRTNRQIRKTGRERLTERKGVVREVRPEIKRLAGGEAAVEDGKFRVGGATQNVLS